MIMKRTMKRFFAVIVTLALLMALGTSAYAIPVDSDMVTESGNSDAIELRVPEVCGGLPYHKLVSSGWGWVYLSNGSLYIDGGCAWQCENCGLVMVTEGDIIFGQMQPIGRWATSYSYDPINNNGCIIRGPSATGQTSSSSLNGYKFFIN